MILQLREAFPFTAAPRHLIFDRDSVFSAAVAATVTSFGIKPGETVCPQPLAERCRRVLDRQRPS